ncbi:MAG TPA: flagellar hook protein FlgE [Stellaceae bacterium]|nr:flagellar hook protein FlgE [Stellaceae bacterium]
MSLNTELMGINAAQTSIDTIGNNIANMNTEGFKGSKMEFADLIGTSLEGTSGNTLTPGQGVVASNLSQLFTEGTISQTGNPLDLAINGQGFFQMQTDQGIEYTRAGSFQVNTNGFVIDPAGNKLMGYTTAGSGAALGAVGDLQVSRSTLPATATSTLGLNVTLPTTDTAIAAAFNPSNASTYDESTATTVYDSVGTGYTLTSYFTRVSGSGTPDKWQVDWQLTDSTGKALASGTGPRLTFSSAGALTGATSGAGTTVSVPTAKLPDGASPLNVTYNFSGTTLSSQTFGVNAIANNGNSAGTFTGIQISSTGQIIGQYSNGQSKAFGTIALANFENPQGLTPMTGTFWQATLASGPALLAAPNTQGLGTLQSGALEGSNVDLSTQLVSLIVAQQAFQANAQAINYEQQNIQHLLNIQ